MKLFHNKYNPIIDYPEDRTKLKETFGKICDTPEFKESVSLVENMLNPPKRKSKLKLGDKVKSLNVEGSFQCSGTIIGLLNANYFASTCKSDPDQTWKIKFPDWKKKPVVVIEFDEAQRSATLKEWIYSAMLKGIASYEAESTYERDCPVTSVAVLPYDDLEKV